MGEAQWGRMERATHFREVTNISPVIKKITGGLCTPCIQSHPAAVQTIMTRIPEELLQLPVLTFRYFTFGTQIKWLSLAWPDHPYLPKMMTKT